MQIESVFLVLGVIVFLVDRSSSTCPAGMFGDSSCLFYDLRTESTITINTNRTITGDNCTLLQKNDFVSIKLPAPIYLSYMRVEIQNNVSSDDLLVYLKGNESMLSLSGIRRLVRGNKVHMQFPQNIGFATDIIVRGDINSTCDILISKGQNIALNNEIKMSSTYDKYNAQKCNDGNMETYCHTGIEEKSPPWIEITFPLHSRIFFYELYNRNSSKLEARTLGSSVHIKDQNDKIQWRYTENGTVPRPILNNSVDPNFGPFKKFAITGRTPWDKEDILHFLEINVYGTYVCSDGFYSDKCKEKCKETCKNGTCMYETGLCPSSCSTGVSGPDCATECDRFTFGPNCKKKCSYCPNGCDNIQGICNECIGPDPFSKCSVCKVGKFGHECQEDCPGHCLHEKCNIVNGSCAKCIIGHWGINCTLSCSENCGGEHECNMANGWCFDGCKPGFEPPTCDVKKSKVVGVMVILFVALAIVFAAVVLPLVIMAVPRKQAMTGEDSLHN